jgi:broad specificity phosphatase PhoE
MKLYFIRHLQTEWNKRGVLQGSNDVSILPPSPQDEIQIEENKQYLLKKESTFNTVLTSSLQRTQQTARCYGYTNLTVEPLLNELIFGEFEGRLKDELVHTIGEQWYEDPSEIILGEPISNLAFRIQSFLEKYKHKKQLLVFAHGSWMRALISYAQSGNLKDMNKIVIINNQLVELNYTYSCTELS